VIRKLALIMVVLMMVFLAWALLGAGHGVSVTINGHDITTPFDAIVGVWGFILTVVILFCIAILLAFVFAGVGLIVMGSLALIGIILAAVAFPFLLPLLIPLFIVWAFCALLRTGIKRTKTPPIKE